MYGQILRFQQDRLWRKNRKPSSTCYGVDINRNFDTNFGGLGASDIACVDTYHGPYSFSEEESSAVRDVLIANRPRVKAAISIHTYSQLVGEIYETIPLKRFNNPFLLF